MQSLLYHILPSLVTRPWFFAKTKKPKNLGHMTRLHIAPCERRFKRLSLSYRILIIQRIQLIVTQHCLAHYQSAHYVVGLLFLFIQLLTSAHIYSDSVSVRKVLTFYRFSYLLWSSATRPFVTDHYSSHAEPSRDGHLVQFIIMFHNFQPPAYFPNLLSQVQ